jgi:hypothetical protein
MELKRGRDVGKEPEVSRGHVPYWHKLNQAYVLGFLLEG